MGLWVLELLAPMVMAPMVITLVVPMLLRNLLGFLVKGMMVG